MCGGRGGAGQDAVLSARGKHSSLFYLVLIAFLGRDLQSKDDLRITPKDITARYIDK